MNQNTILTPGQAAILIFLFVGIIASFATCHETRNQPSVEDQLNDTLFKDHSEIQDTTHSCPAGFEYYPTEMVGNCILVEGCSNDSMRRFALETMTGCVLDGSIYPGKMYRTDSDGVRHEVQDTAFIEEGEPGILYVDSAQWKALVDSLVAGFKRRDSILGPLKFDTVDSAYQADTVHSMKFSARMGPRKGWQVYEEPVGRVYLTDGDETIAEWENDKLKILNRRKYAEWEEFCRKSKAERIIKMEDSL